MIVDRDTSLQAVHDVQQATAMATQKLGEAEAQANKYYYEGVDLHTKFQEATSKIEDQNNAIKLHNEAIHNTVQLTQRAECVAQAAVEEGNELRLKSWSFKANSPSPCRKRRQWVSATRLSSSPAWMPSTSM